jgi:hypothetical protein
LQYKAKKLFNDVIAFFDPKTKKVRAVNDKIYSVTTYYKVMAITFDGKVLFKDEKKL